MNKEIFNILINSVNTTQYMTKLRSEKFLKLNNYDDGKNIVEYLESSSKKNDYDIVNQLQEYEYDKIIDILHYINMRIMILIKKYKSYQIMISIKKNLII